MAFKHPFATLQPQEITKSSEIICRTYPEKHVTFRVIAIKEPVRFEVTQYLKTQHSTSPSPCPPRRTYAIYQFEGEVETYEDVIDMTTGVTVSHKQLETGLHAPASPDDMLDVQKLVLEDTLVKAELARLKLPENAKVVPEAWPYGKDTTIADSMQYQVWFFLGSLGPNARDHPSSNHFAHPLDFSAVVDHATRKVIRIDRLPMNEGLFSTSDEDEPYESNPDAEYATDLQASIRSDLKPLVITQPQGVSFSVEDDQVVSWQKWRFHVDFNWREGVVLRDVRYDDRPVFYRLSLAEMTVPYGDPRPPYHRKSAYDLGEGGAGATANNLRLGCDCLGAIYYFNRWVHDSHGRPKIKENCICMHEVDSGLGWKHTNASSGRAEVTRSRELVIQTVGQLRLTARKSCGTNALQIMTISNYDYVLSWVLDTAACIHYEIRATGIMSVVPMRQNVEHDLSYGIMVSPGVMAPCHQHIFCLRLDPAIDDYQESSIVYQETLPLAVTEKGNPYGVAYEIRSNPITTSGHLDLDVSKNRTVKFVNNKRTNPVTGHSPGYAIHVPATQLQLAHATSVHHRRAEFADHHFYFTKSSNEELYPAGEYPWQSVGGTGLRKWASRSDDLGNNGVAWCTFGLTHNPRPEDWPVMPCEVMRVALKPSHFFTKNPALDMPASSQAINQSTIVDKDCVVAGHCPKL